MMATARVRFEASEKQSKGSLLVILVNLSVVFLLVVAMLNKPKGSDLFTEQNLLFAALVLYGASAVLYVAFAVSAIGRYARWAEIAASIGFVANTLAAAHRWYIAGHPPFSNIYEMLLSFVWMVAGLTLWSERRYGLRAIGTMTMPLATIGVLLMQLMPSEVRPLVPALQSTWLHVHVTLAMLAYAACAVSFALAMMYLVQSGVSTETFLVATTAGLIAVYGGLMSRFAAGGLEVVAVNPETNKEVYLTEKFRLLVTIPDLGWFFALVLLVVVAPLGLFLLSKRANNPRTLQLANGAFAIGAVLQLFATVAFITRVRGGSYSSRYSEGLFVTSPAASPFILAGLIGGLVASLLYLLLRWRRDRLEKLFPPADKLDVLTYKTIGLAFPLLTAMIAAGAYWANRAWGAYWSWDPKETWAAITWLVYAGYLHMRITRGWRGRRAAYFAVLGFAVVMFTFFGVTYLLPGMHSY
jgi:cytochrome c-type biogenesis protein CcsB